MQFLIDLWPPILVSAVFVFVVSSVIHMALPIHKNDHGKLAGEESVLASMQRAKRQAGEAIGSLSQIRCRSSARQR